MERNAQHSIVHTENESYALATSKSALKVTNLHQYA